MDSIVRVDQTLDRDQAAVLRGYLQQQAADAASRIVQAGLEPVREYRGIGDGDEGGRERQGHVQPSTWKTIDLGRPAETGDPSPEGFDPPNPH